MNEEPEKSRDAANRAAESDSRSGHGGSRNFQHEQNGTDRGERRPFGDALELYDIPKTRPEDPPMRRWWFEDDESDHRSS
jgi:hypothetical protein